MPGGDYLKLLGVVPTPYLWIANSKWDGCVYGDNCGMVSKIRAFPGKKKDCTHLADGTVDCIWINGTWEERGEFLGAFPTVDKDPSRTAVRAETGEVWVANRGSTHVVKFDINGKRLATCKVGNSPRGVAIEENGDVWVGNSLDDTVTKLKGDNSCQEVTTISSGGTHPYGLAIDSYNNVWIAHRAGGNFGKINTQTDTLAGVYPVNSTNTLPYGITVDLVDTVWAGDYSNGVFKIPAGTPFASGAQYYQFPSKDVSGRTRGVTVDLSGNIWLAVDSTSQALKITDLENPHIPGNFTLFNTDSVNPVGIVGASDGSIWLAGLHNGILTALDMNGNKLPLPVNNEVNPGKQIRPYTYSDMTGMNRAIVLRTGTWMSKILNSGYYNQHWGTIDKTVFMPPPELNKTFSLEIFVRASNNSATLPTTSWMTETEWNSDLSKRAGQYVQVKVVIKSNKRGATPVLNNLNFKCN